MPQNNGGLTRAWSGQPRPCTSRMAAYCERGLPLKRKPLGRSPGLEIGLDDPCVSRPILDYRLLNSAA